MAPTVADGTVYIGGSPFSDELLYAVDATSGDEQWVYEEPERSGERPTVADGRIFLQTTQMSDQDSSEALYVFETTGETARSELRGLTLADLAWRDTNAFVSALPSCTDPLPGHVLSVDSRRVV